MASVPVVAVLVVIVLGVLAVSVWRGRAPAQFILGILPLALLLVTLPLIASLQQMTRDFVQMGEGGGGDPARRQMTVMVAVAARQLCLTVAAFLLAMWAAAALQWAAMRWQRGPAPADALSLGEKSWGGFVLVVSSTLAIPAAWVTHSTVRLLGALPLVSAGRTTEEMDAIAKAAFGATEGNASRLIADHLVPVMATASILTLLLVIFSIGGLVVIARRKVPSILAPYSWLVLALVTVGGGWALIELVPYVYRTS